MKILKIFIISIISGLVFGQSQKEESVNIFDEVRSWEQARRVFDLAIMQQDFNKKMDCYDRVLNFYLQQKPMPYEDIAMLYSSKAIDFIKIEQFEDVQKIIDLITSTLPKEFFYKTIALQVRVELQKGTLEKVVELCNEYEKLKGDNPLSKAYKGLAYMQSGDYQKAKEMFSYILNKNPKAQLEKLYRAMCNTYLKQYDEALLDLDKYIKARRIHAPESLPYYYKALCLYNKGDYVQARECLEKGRQINVVDIVELSKRNDAIFKKKIEGEIEEIVKKMDEAEKSGSVNETGK